MTHTNTRAALAAALLLAAVSCGKAKTEAELREEVLACSRVNSQAELIALCLESDHKWADSAADRAGRLRAHELDSTFAWQQDSAFNVDAVQHRKDIRECSSGDVVRDCLKLRGWPDDRAARAADSLWRKDLARHLVQVRTCAGQRREPIASCLVLHYRWSSPRALATQDSIQRARMTR
jgi:hypothetical protein